MSSDFNKVMFDYIEKGIAKSKRNTDDLNKKDFYQPYLDDDMTEQEFKEVKKIAENNKQEITIKKKKVIMHLNFIGNDINTSLSKLIDLGKLEKLDK